MRMKKARMDGLYLMLLGSAVFLFLGLALKYASRESGIDFKVPYYSARCLLQHCDPYMQSDVLRIYEAEGGERPGETPQDRLNSTRFVYFPTLFLFTSPLALLPFEPAHVLWTVLTLGSVLLASFLLWNLAVENAPLLSACLIGFMLANSVLLVIIVNPAGIAIALCIIAVWCFIKERYEAAGVWCLAVSLLVKPHDVGFVWLYFLLAGGVYRKRALQTLALVIALGLPTILCVTHFSPHWMPELRSTVSSAAAHGGPDDPGPASTGAHGLGMMINLQTALSYFRDDPHFYNSVTYLICGVLLMAWFAATARSRPSPVRTSLALAAIAPLSLLPVYHRQSDVLILLFAVPACAILWSERDLLGRLAFMLTAAGFVLTGDFAWVLLHGIIGYLPVPGSQLSGKILVAVQLMPIPLILLAMTIFYLWVYVRRAHKSAPPEKHKPAEDAPIGTVTA